MKKQSPWMHISIHPSQRKEQEAPRQNYKLGNTRRTIDDLKTQHQFDKDFNYL